MAPQLEEPDVKYDPEKNEINIKLTGKAGPMVEVSFLHYILKESKQQKLLPLKREGNLDYSVIDEGGRRVKLQLQNRVTFLRKSRGVHGDAADTKHRPERQRGDLPRTESSQPRWQHHHQDRLRR